jgi:surfactin synthase thioesterase subunit
VLRIGGRRGWLAVCSLEASLSSLAVPTRWIITPRPNRSAAVRLICVPPAGGGANTFAGWADRLPSVELQIAQLPGRGPRLREAPLPSIAAAADGLTDALSRLPACPSVLFGHGLGALIALETARRLRERSAPVVALFPSGCPAPRLPRHEPPIADLPEPAFLDEVCRRMGDSLEPAPVDTELLAAMVPGLRGEFAMAEQYRHLPGQPLECPIVACGGRADTGVTTAALEEWGRETRGRSSVRLFPGDALYLVQERAALTAFIANQLTVFIGALSRWMGAP